MKYTTHDKSARMIIVTCNSNICKRSLRHFEEEKEIDTEPFFTVFHCEVLLYCFVPFRKYRKQYNTRLVSKQTEGN
jgi:hypothetical protein